MVEYEINVSVQCGQQATGEQPTAVQFRFELTFNIIYSDTEIRNAALAWVILPVTRLIIVEYHHTDRAQGYRVRYACNLDVNVRISYLEVRAAQPVSFRHNSDHILVGRELQDASNIFVPFARITAPVDRSHGLHRSHGRPRALGRIVRGASVIGVAFIRWGVLKGAFVATDIVLDEQPLVRARDTFLPETASRAANAVDGVQVDPELRGVNEERRNMGAKEQAGNNELADLHGRSWILGVRTERVS